ncbi:MAG TPA: hypothetical protein GYA07_05195 [Verrucomicrobia bacterium]|nr:hypothetical protein [Verrucomicrobiota bacterium]
MSTTFIEPPPGFVIDKPAPPKVPPPPPGFVLDGPQSYVVESPDGLKLAVSFTGEPPSEATITEAFENYRTRLRGQPAAAPTEPAAPANIDPTWQVVDLGPLGTAAFPPHYTPEQIERIVRANLTHMRAQMVRSAGPKGSPERKQALLKMHEAIAKEPVPEVRNDLSRLKSAGQSAMRGGGTMLGNTLQGVNRALMNAFVWTPEETEVGRQVAAKLGKTAVPPGQVPQLREQMIEGSPMAKLGRTVSEGAKEAFQPNPQYAGEFWTDVLPSAAGGMVPTVASGIVAGPAGAVSQYGAAAGQQGREEAIAAGSPDDADKAFAAYLGIGALSEAALGVPARIWSIVRAARAAKLPKEQARNVILRAIAEGSIRESAQESLEQVGQNVVAQQTFDPERPLMQDVPESAAAGFILGGTVSGGAAGVGRLSQPDPAKELARILSASPQEQISSAAINVQPVVEQGGAAVPLQFSPYFAGNLIAAEEQQRQASVGRAMEAEIAELMAAGREAGARKLHDVQLLEAVPNPEKRPAQQAPAILPQQQVVADAPIIEGAPVQPVSTPQALATGQRVLRSLQFDTPQQRGARAMLRRGSAPTPQAPSPSPIVQLPERRLRSTEPLPSRTSQQPQLRAVIMERTPPQATPAKPSSGPRKSRKVPTQAVLDALQPLRTYALSKSTSLTTATEDEHSAIEHLANVLQADTAAADQFARKFWDENTVSVVSGRIKEAKAWITQSAPQPRSVNAPAQQTTGFTPSSASDFQTRYQSEQGIEQVLAAIASQSPRQGGLGELAGMVSALPIRSAVRFLFDPTADFAGRYDPQTNSIEINLAKIADESGVQNVALHEAIHALTVRYIEFYESRSGSRHGIQDANLLAIFDAIDALAQLHADAQASLAQNPELRYGLSNLKEFVSAVMTDAQMQSTLRGGNGSLWQRFVEALKRIIRSIFGWNPLQVSPLDQATEAVLTIAKTGSPELSESVNREVTEAGDRSVRALPHFKRSEDVEALKSAPGMTPDRAATVEEMAGAQAGALSSDPGTRILERLSAEPQELKDAVYQRWMRPIGDLLKVSASPRLLTDVADAPARRAAAMMIVFQDEQVRGRVTSLWREIERRQDELTRIARSIPKMNAAEAASSLLSATAENGSRSFTQYLRALAKTTRSLSESAAQILNSSAMKLDGHLVPPSVIKTVLEQIASNPAIVVEGKTPHEIVAQVRAVGGIKLVPSQAAYLDVLIGDVNGAGINGLDPLLHRIRNLANAISSLREINAEKAESEKAIREFQEWFGKQGTVSAREWARRYAKLTREARRASEIARGIRADLNRVHERLMGAIAAVQDAEALVDAPAYRQAMESAVGETGVRMLMVDDSGGSFYRIKGPITGTEYRLSLVPTQETERQNIEQCAALLHEIQTALQNAQLTPIERESLNHAAEYVRNWMDPALGPKNTAYDNLDIKNMLGWLRTRQQLLESIGGRPVRKAQADALALDAIGDQISKLAVDRDAGDFRFTVLVAAALKARGLKTTPANVEYYQESVSNPVLASYQHFGGAQYKVGDVIPVSGEKVLPEDIAVMLAQHQHDEQLRKIGEARHGGAEPILIHEEISGVKMIRRAVPTGPRTVPRGLMQWAVNLAHKWSAAKADERAALLNQFFTDPILFRRVVLAYAFEPNPDFTFAKKYRAAFQHVAQAVSAGDLTVQSIEELTDAVAGVQGVDAATISDEFLAAVRAEVTAFLNRFSEMVVGTMQATNLESIRKFLVISLEVDGSFVKPRGDLLAPSSFYKFSRIDAQERRSLRGNLMNAASVRLIDSMRNTLDALLALRRDLAAELERAGRNPADRKEALQKQAALRRSGEIRYDLAELDSRIEVMQTEIRKSERAADRGAEDLRSAAREVLSELGRPLSAFLLSPPKTTIGNYFSGSFVAQVVLDAHTRGAMRAMITAGKWPLSVGKQIIGNTVRALMSVPAFRRYDPTMLRSAAEFVFQWADEQSALAQRLRDMGITQPFDAGNRFEAELAAPWGTGGRLYTDEHFPTSIGWHAFVRPLRFFNSWVTQWLGETWSPRAADIGANMLNLGLAIDYMRWLSSFGKRISDTRGGPDNLDPTKPAQEIKPEELGITPRQMRWLREYLMPAGSLEAIMFDYARRLMAAPEESRADVPLIDDSTEAGKAKLLSIIRAFAQRSNALKRTNAPTTFFLSSEWSVLGFFKKYAANAVDQFTKMFPMGRRVDWHTMDRELATLIIATILLTLGGIASYELGLIGNRLVMNKESGLPSLAHITSQPEGDRAIGKYLGASMANVMPYAGFFADIALGGHTRSPFDVANYIPHLDFIRFGTGEVNKAVRSGDFSKAAFNLVNRYGGIYSGALNRLPGFREMNVEANVARSLRAAAPPSLEPRPFMGGAGRTTPATRHLRATMTAALAGDRSGAMTNLERLLRYKQASGMSRQEAVSSARRQLAAKSPEWRAFGKTLAPKERKGLESSLTRRQLRSLQSTEAITGGLRTLLDRAKNQDKRRNLRALSF